MRTLLVLPLLLLTACGSGSPAVSSPPAGSAAPATSASAAPGAPAGPARTVQVVARDYSFSGLEGLSLKAGDTLSVTLLNQGNLPHNFAVAGPDGNRVGGVEVIDGGQQVSGSIVLATAGVYTYVCTVGSHAELGMKGTFTVS